MLATYHDDSVANVDERRPRIRQTLNPVASEDHDLVVGMAVDWTAYIYKDLKRKRSLNPWRNVGHKTRIKDQCGIKARYRWEK